MAIIDNTALHVQELWRWLVALEPNFAFLMALPFIVAAAGLARYWYDQRRSRPR